MKYEKYKPSGIDWIGDFPNQWQFRRLKNVCSVNKDVLTEKTPHDYLIEYIDIGNTNENGEFIEVQEIEFSEAPSRARRKVEHGDTIISTVRTYLRAIAFIENPKENLIVSTGFAMLNANKNILLPKFLFYQVLCDSFIQRVIANSEGVSYPAISSTKLADLKLLIPSIKEQLTIANYLDEQTQKIDRLIANKKAQSEKLKELRQIEINNAVTKGLNHKAEMKDSGIEWLGKIPKHWQVKRLKNFTTKIGSGVTPKGGSEVYEDSGIPIFRSQNVHFDGLRLDDVAYINEQIHNSMSGSKVEPNDVLLNITGASIGRCYYYDGSLGEANVNQHVCIIRTNKKLNHLFLHWLLSSNSGQSQILMGQVGTSREGLTFQDIKNIGIGA